MATSEELFATYMETRLGSWAEARAHRKLMKALKRSGEDFYDLQSAYIEKQYSETI